jgi:hypothetical protein
MKILLSNVKEAVYGRGHILNSLCVISPIGNKKTAIKKLCTEGQRLAIAKRERGRERSD